MEWFIIPPMPWFIAPVELISELEKRKKFEPTSIALPDRFRRIHRAGRRDAAAPVRSRPSRFGAL
jgi:hypothetical protein